MLFRTWRLTRRIRPRFTRVGAATYRSGMNLLDRSLWEKERLRKEAKENRQRGDERHDHGDDTRTPAHHNQQSGRDPELERDLANIPDGVQTLDFHARRRRQQRGGSGAVV